jgi:hypothetical protein
MLIAQYMRKLSFSKIALFMVIVLVFTIDNNIGLWKSKIGVIIIDVCAYCTNLPAIFIYNDLAPESLNDSKIGDQFILRPKDTSEGKNVIASSSGMTVLSFPFFITSHLISHLFDYPATGYSLPYRYGLMLSSLYYLALGQFFLRKLLIKYLKIQAAAIEISILQLFIFWTIKSIDELKAKYFLFYQYLNLMVLMIVAFFLAWIPKLLNKSLKTGHIFYNLFLSYQGILPGNQKTVSKEFSFCKGWLIYKLVGL